MIVYLAGPMSGMMDDNIPAFLDTANELRGLGYVVFCPCEMGTRDLATWEAYVARDTEKLIAVDAVAVMPGWQHSRGALLEVFAARVYGKRVLDAEALRSGDVCEIRVKHYDMKEILRLIREAFAGKEAVCEPACP